MIWRDSGTLHGTSHLRVCGSSGGIEGRQTLDGTATISFESPGSTAEVLEATSDFTILTLGPDVTVHGGGGVIGGSVHFGRSMSVINQGTIRADIAGQTLTVTGAAVTNQGILEATSGSIMDVNNLAGNVGTASATGGGHLDLNGTYTIDQTLTITDSTLTLQGNWTNAATIDATDSTVNLGGTFTLAELGVLNRMGGTVNLTGTLDNSGIPLALNATTGDWQVNGGTIDGGTVAMSEGAQLVFANNTNNRLRDVTSNGDLDFPSLF